MNLLISGLAQYEAVIVGESMILQLAENTYLSHRDYLIDGEHRTINSPQLTLNKDSVIKKIIKGSKQIIGLTLKDGSYVGYRTYVAQRDKYAVGEWGDDVEYPSLEAEFEHRKLMQSYEGSEWVYEETPDTYEDVNIKIVGEVADTGSEYIENALSYGQGKFNNSGFYRLDLLGVITNTVNKFAKQYELTTYNSGTSSVEFIQMGGSYVFNSSFKYNNCFKSNRYRVVTTLLEAKVLENEVANDTWKYLSLKFGANLKVTSDSAKIIHEKLCSVQARVNGLDVKQKSESTLRLVKKEITELQEALYNIIKGDY